VAGHFDVRRAQGTEFIFEHFEQDQLTGGAGERGAGFIRLGIELNVTEKAREQGVGHSGSLPSR
jgi:hypothetical protein